MAASYVETLLSLRPERLSPLHRYGFAVLTVMAGTALHTLILGPVAHFLFFYPAVVVSALLAGFRSGAAATLLSAVSTHYVLFEPRFAWAAGDTFEARILAIFILNGLLLSALVQGLHQLRSDTESSRRQAQRHARALEESERRFRLMADSAPVMISMTTPDGGSEWFNQGWLAFRGRLWNEDLGEGWRQGIHPDDRANADRELAAALQQRRPFTLELRLLRHDDAWRWVIGRGVPRYSPDGAFLGFVASWLDIDDRKRLEEERVRLLDEARSASRHKDEFLAVLSHELRTPLNAVLTWAQLLRLPEGRQKLDHGLTVIERNARLQMQLIKELLDVSRIIAGKLEIERDVIPLGSAVEAAVEGVRGDAQAKGVLLEVSLPPEGGLVEGDGERLQQVVGNLLTNAVRFSPTGGTIRVVLEEEKDVRLEVSDEGEGISPVLLPHVFDRFRQSDASTTRKHGGLGLGLAIARDLVRLHLGSIEAHSDGQGNGATFVVRLPRAGEQGAPLQRREEGEPPVRLDGLRLLVVDDQEDSREAVAAALATAGAHVTSCGGGEEALQALEKDGYDALVADIAMPGMDGYQLLEELVRRHGAGWIPAVAVTALARREDRLRAAAAGFRAHVAKPVDVRQLTVELARLARRPPGAA